MASLLLGAPPMASQSLALSSSLSFSKSQASLSASVSSIATSASAPTPIFSFSVYCGRGDKKTARGKRFNHSFGNARPRDKKKGRGPPKVPAPALPPRKDKYDDGEIVRIEIDESLFTN
ncbi:30S ribosomal protein S31, chloroplastic [Andrographis paniculata]|uniref:30S ribosomal protein S31, chloroplastic n=1 Tax=Andrographis paniculata TaxID=175694 RepID=UPI0021E76D6A|nr:30S ribosomal protein S31, chloroplastic [Andrographis paniculata]